MVDLGRRRTNLGDFIIYDQVWSGVSGKLRRKGRWGDSIYKVWYPPRHHIADEITSSMRHKQLILDVSDRYYKW